MNTRSRQIISLGAVLLSALAFGQAASANDEHRTDTQIRTCVAAIGDHADYTDAERVVHRITRLRQRNYAELEMRIDTAVYGAGDVREYAASCVTHTLGDIVRLRVRPVED